jgi:hypothetical protein
MHPPFLPIKRCSRPPPPVPPPRSIRDAAHIASDTQWRMGIWVPFCIFFQKREEKTVIFFDITVIAWHRESRFILFKKNFKKMKNKTK